MNTYLIQQKVESFSEIYEQDKFTINGYLFEQWEYKHLEPNENAWLIQKHIDSENIIDAMNQFKNELIPILNRVSLISQCGIQCVENSIFVLKTNNNQENIFFLIALDDSEEVPLSFQTEEIESLKKIINMENEVIFDLLSVSNLSMTNHSRLVPLILALEAMAGEREIISQCSKCGDTSRKYLSTDKEKIKLILDDSNLYKKIYHHNDGLRNKLFHGKIFEFRDGVDYAQRIYDQIIRYFNKVYGTKICTETIGVPRNGLGKYTKGKVWAKPKSTNDILDLRTLLPLFNKKRKSGFRIQDDSDFNNRFNIIHPATKDFVEKY